MTFELEVDLTPERFAEVGEPTRLFREPTRGLAALASTMPGLGYPGRWLFPDHPARPFRLSVYSEKDSQLLGVIATTFPVNDVAFSPEDNSVLVATGSYDGGWNFDGYLLRYDWCTGRTEQLLGACREVVACRYESGGKIALLLRPCNEEEFEGDAWGTVVGMRIDAGPGRWLGQPVEVRREDERMNDLRPCASHDYGFSDEVVHRDLELFQLHKREATTWLQERCGQTRHQAIRDLMWLDFAKFAVAGDGLTLEVRQANGGVSQRFEMGGNSVELVRHPRFGILSHVQKVGPHPVIGHTQLWRWRQGKMPTLVWESDRLSEMGFDSSGHVLARDQSWGNNSDRKNVLLGPKGKILRAIDCGTSDRAGLSVFGHGLDTIFFLKREGDDIGSNQDYRLWRHEGKENFVQLRRWDPPERDFCPVTGVAYSDGMFLGAGPIYDRVSHSPRIEVLELLEMNTGRRVFSIPLQRSPTRVALSDDRLTAVVASADGSLTFFDLQSQRAGSSMRLEKHGIPSVPLALAIQRDQMLIGTQDGRILLGTLKK